VEGVVAIGGGSASILGGDREQVDVGVPGVGGAVVLEGLPRASKDGRVSAAPTRIREYWLTALAW
jgi:hypothetical protein